MIGVHRTPESGNRFSQVVAPSIGAAAAAHRCATLSNTSSVETPARLCFDRLRAPEMTMPTHKDSCAELLSLAVHEFRTPVSVVGGYLRMLQRDEDTLSERQRKWVDDAEKSCARLVALIAEMSEVSQFDAGMTTLRREPLDVFTAVQEVAAGVHEAKDREVRFEVRGQATGAPVTGDSARLRGAFTAIFKAILREQPSACTVVADRRIASRDGASSAVVVVARLDNVQAAYDASPAAFDEKRGGLGFALPIARRIIEGHGGRLWAPATSAERGAAVVSLPISESNR
jgi:K+-sensing histidine kinase KdpD